MFACVHAEVKQCSRYGNIYNLYIPQIILTTLKGCQYYSLQLLSPSFLFLSDNKRLNSRVLQLSVTQQRFDIFPRELPDAAV